MEERRRFVRASARLDAAYTVLPETALRAAVTKDVSGGGARLITDKILAPGTSLQMAVTLSGQDAPVNTIGEVVWSEPSAMTTQALRRQSAESGIRFAEISPSDRDTLMVFVGKSLFLIP